MASVYVLPGAPYTRNGYHAIAASWTMSHLHSGRLCSFHPHKKRKQCTIRSPLLILSSTCASGSPLSSSSRTKLAADKVCSCASSMSLEIIYFPLRLTQVRVCGWCGWEGGFWPPRHHLSAKVLQRTKEDAQQSHSQEHQQPQSLSPQDKGSHCQIRQYKNGFLLSAQQPAPTVLGCCAPHANQHASKNAQAASHLWALDERDWILDETEWALLSESVQPPRAVSSSLRSSEAAKRESFDAPTAAICHRLTQYPIWLP